MLTRFFILLSILLLCKNGFSQQAVGDVDSAFVVARKLAFSSKYHESIRLCQRILKKSPTYSDVQVLLGRVYFWNNQTDSALQTLSSLLARKPYEDGYLAITDILRWNDNFSDALHYVNDGIKNFPKSEDLVVRKAQIIYGIGNYKQAYSILDSLLKKDKNNQQARVLVEKTKRNLYNSSVSASYDYDHFDKRFSDDWHIAAVSYSRRTKLFGSVIGRVNYANRFGNSNGLQFEVDMYPSLGKKMYAYLSGGYSRDSLPFDKFHFSPFPRFRYGISVYRSLPKAFEIELGIRYLLFSSPVFIYTGSIGKYYRSFWFSLRPTVVFNNNGSGFSQSYNFITRYYTKSANDYFSISLGYGIAPDDRTAETLLQNPNLHFYKVRMGYQWMIQSKYIFQLSGAWLGEEFTQYYIKYGNDYSFGVGLQRLF